MNGTIESMNDTIELMYSEKLSLYIGNLLVRFIDKLYEQRGIEFPVGLGNDPSRSASRYTQAATRIGLKNWKKEFNLPTKYYKSLERFSEV